MRRRRRRALALAICAVGLGILMVMLTRGRDDELRPITQIISATPEVTMTPVATGTPEATSTPEVTATPELVPVTPHPPQAQLPSNPAWDYTHEVFTDGRAAAWREENLDFGASRDDALPGVLTFRGNHMRQNAAYGTAALSECRFSTLWKNHIGAIDSGYTEWTGVGWTGQPALVRWPEQVRRSMDLKEEYLDRDDLVEVIYATLDGNIYFLDALTGEATRDPIHLGFPIKGSVTVDPRGYPLLYVGQGISRADGVTGDIGWRIYSLIDRRELYFLDGRDKLSPRDHGAFDGSCLICPEADCALQGGENGLFYIIRLNTRYDPDAPSISVSPQVTAYRYRSSISEELGIENSVAAWGHYAWFADNSGLLTCLDLHTLAPVWLKDLGDDTDATLALEEGEAGELWLYTVNQVDKQGPEGRCTLRRLDAMTGVDDWLFGVDCTSDGVNGGGGFASPAVGKGAYGEYVYFNVCRTEGGGRIYCFNKSDGSVVWSASTGSASWSSPVLVYREDGTGVLIVCNIGGRGGVRMLDPATGERLGQTELEGKIEASPGVFDDVMVIGTRDRRIYGLRLM